MARQARASPGAAYDLGYHVVWCPKYRRPVLGGRVKARMEELIRAKADEHGRQIVALEVMPDHVHLSVKPHPKHSPSYVANQFKGFTSHHLRAEFPHLRSRLTTLWSRSSFVATVGAVSAGHVRVHQHRPAWGRVKTIGIKREGSRWHVMLSCDDVPAESLPATGAVAGIDMGVASLVTSDGTHVANPRHLAATAGRLTDAQRDLARKKRGSKQRRKAVARVAAPHAKVRRQRLDHAHKTALALVRDYDVIVHEDLRITDMTKRAAPKPDGAGGYLPNGTAARSGLSTSILDAGWGVFLTILSHKAESAGRELIVVNPANTSRTCARCGHCAAENRATQAEFACTACGHAVHADMNAAINILRAGFALRDAAEAA